MWVFRTFSLTVFVIICALTLEAEASVGGYICPAVKKKFAQILQKALNPDEDVLNIYYGTTGLKLLDQTLDKSGSKQICDKIKNDFKPTDNLEVIHASLSVWASLGCNGNLHTDSTIKDVNGALESDKTTTSNIRYALEILNLLKIKTPAPAKLAQLLQSKLKEDDSLGSIGNALHASTWLGNSGKFALERVEEVVVQTDEVDGKLLQWEGGLTTTSLLITGLLKVPGATPFTPQQAEKLANYLLTRKTVQTPKGVLALLEAAKALTDSKVSPISISIIGAGRVTPEEPEVKVQISDILGRPLKTPPTPPVVQSIKKLPQLQLEISAKQTLTQGSSPTEFVMNLRGLHAGHYQIVLESGGQSATLTVRVLAPISIDSLEIGLGDIDGSSGVKLSKLTQPKKLSEALQGDSSQQLVVKFALPRLVHQAFLRLYTEKKEIIFVAEPDIQKLYKVEVNLANELGLSGNYNIELIIGDDAITNPIRWVLGALDLNLGAPETSPKTPITRGPKPEIHHLFRPAERRPPEVVSLFFTALVAAPLLILLILWAKIGVNFGNFSVTALPFHLGLGGILGLFTLFWLKLDMFTTCAWLIPVGAFTFLSGHKLLSGIAGARAAKKQ